MAMTPEERYRRDPEFHMLVDTIYQWIERCQYTPTEVREAAMLAAVKHSMERTSAEFVIEGYGRCLCGHVGSPKHDCPMRSQQRG